VPDEIGHEAVLERARAEFSGPVEIARPRLRIEV
jgi:hypothetical protein